MTDNPNTLNMPNTLTQHVSAPVLIPRNTAVAVVEIKDEEIKTDAGVILPAGTGKTYSQCEVYAVGRGLVTEGTESETADLKPGQRVLVQLRQQNRGVNAMGQPSSSVTTAGIEFKDAHGREIIIVEQMQILAILSD